MHQFDPFVRRVLRTLLLLLVLLAACQGRGRVHEAPPASYPEDAPAEPARAPEAAREFPLPSPLEQEAAGDVDRSAQPSPAATARAESRRPQGGGVAAAAPEMKAESSTALGSGDRRDSSWERGPLSPRKPPEHRPGLATHWGESRYSPARQVDFERRDPERPSATVELHYNDRAGARRMLPDGSWGRAEAYAVGGLRLRIVDAGGRTFPALTNGSRVIGVGAPGERYAIEIENPTGARFEVVASVDGLDVLDGEDASFEKRGYLIGAYSSVSIDGFRTSDAEVAAFRLGDVARSYAASKGKARNVGVIGFALFEERRPIAAPVWRQPAPPDDTEQRRSADPFPGRFARPPVW